MRIGHDGVLNYSPSVYYISSAVQNFTMIVSIIQVMAKSTIMLGNSLLIRTHCLGITIHEDYHTPLISYLLFFFLSTCIGHRAGPLVCEPQLSGSEQPLHFSSS